MTNLYYGHTSSGSVGVYDAVPPSQNESLTISSQQWATIALEISHP